MIVVYVWTITSNMCPFSQVNVKFIDNTDDWSSSREPESRYFSNYESLISLIVVTVRIILKLSFEKLFEWSMKIVKIDSNHAHSCSKVI